MSSSSSLSPASSSSPTRSQDVTAAEMKRIESSNSPIDIATLAYIWGYSLVSWIRPIDFATNPNSPPISPAHGPLNVFHHFRELANASVHNVVSPNADTLYSIARVDLKNGPLVLQVPPISDRYYVLQFIDAYTNNFFYVGTRTNTTSGGSYLITGPTWNGTAATSTIEGMKEIIKSPTNTMVIAARILVKSPEDVSNLRALQDKLVLSPLSVVQDSDNASTTSTTTSSILDTASSSQPPQPPEPAFIPKTGIKIYDEIGKDMANNPPPQNQSNLVAKFKTIGIGPGLKPSETTANSNNTIKQALENGITNGEKIIDAKANSLGTVTNGWVMNLQTGDFGTDYLLRAAIAKTLLGANSAKEAVYPYTYVDNEGKNLTGTNKYVIHFDKDKIPPVKTNGFWSISMYNSKRFFVDNPMNRYTISDRTPGLKYNSDGSLDVYIQHDNPGKDKESNWLPAPSNSTFNLTLRMYIPQEQVLNGQYQIPPVQIVR